MPIDDSDFDRAMRAACAEVARQFHEDMDIASQEDAALVAAMARQAQEDADLIDGAALTEREARALWTLEASGMGKERS